MGDEKPAGDDGFVENATSETQEEVVSTPPADDVTPTEAVEEQGAEKGLTGDEAEAQAYLNEKYKDLGDNDREQIMRWRNGNATSKTLKADVDRLTEEAGTSNASVEALVEVARLIPGGVEALKEKGPEEFVKWASGDEKPDAEPDAAALDPNDPVQRRMLAMEEELKGLRDERSETDLDRQQTEIVEYIQQGVKALKLPDDDKGTTKAVVMRLAENFLATPGNAENPQVPTQKEADAALAEAGKILSSYNSIRSGVTEKKIEDGAPKTPEVVTEQEAKPASSADYDDWDDKEDAGFMSNASRD